MGDLKNTTWLSIQKVRRRERRTELIRGLLEKTIITSLIILIIIGLISIIFFFSGYKFTRQALAAEIKIEQPAAAPAEEEKKPEAKKEEPAKISDGQIIKTLKAVCSANGMNDPKNNEVCWQTLWAMSYQESKLGYLMIGDQGRSKGWFHIQTKMHQLSEACALDLNCSADWTLKRLITKGFPIYWTYSVQSHNGFGTPAAKRGEYAEIIKKEIASLDK